MKCEQVKQSDQVVYMETTYSQENPVPPGHSIYRPRDKPFVAPPDLVRVLTCVKINPFLALFDDTYVQTFEDKKTLFYTAVDMYPHRIDEPGAITGKTALRLAVGKLDLWLIDQLVQHGANPLIIHEGMTPLSLMVEKCNNSVLDWGDSDLPCLDDLLPYLASLYEGVEFRQKTKQ